MAQDWNSHSKEKVLRVAVKLNAEEVGMLDRLAAEEGASPADFLRRLVHKADRERSARLSDAKFQACAMSALAAATNVPGSQSAAVFFGPADASLESGEPPVAPLWSSKTEVPGLGSIYSLAFARPLTADEKAATTALFPGHLALWAEPDRAAPPGQLKVVEGL